MKRWKGSTMGPVPIQAYVALSAIIFAIGGVGVLVRRNPLIILMCIELMWNAVNLAFIAFSRQANAPDGHVFAFLVMTVAAAEAAIGLAIIVLLFRREHRVDVDDLRRLAG